MAGRRFFQYNSASSDDERRDNTVAVRPTSGRDVVTTQQSDQLHENSSGDEDNQLATGSSVHAGDIKGDVQIGGKNIVHKTYNSHNHNHIHKHYHYPLPPNHHHGNSSTFISCPCPDCLHSSESRDHSNSSKSTHKTRHCPKCIDYHDNDHPPLAEQPEHRPPPPTPDPQQLGLPRVPQLLPPTSPQKEQVESTEKRDNVTSRESKQNARDRLKHNTRDHKSSDSPRLASSDVTHHVSGSRQRERAEEKAAVNTKVVDTKPRTSHTSRADRISRLKEKTRDERSSQSQQGERREENMAEKIPTTQEVPKSAVTRQVADVPDTVDIIDSRGQQLQPGDAVFSGSSYKIYVGDMDVVWCLETGRRVEKEKLTMTEPFRKVTITSCEIFPPRERVTRAESWVGKRFTEEDGLWWWRGEDFVAWVCTGRTWSQADLSGFNLQ